MEKPKWANDHCLEVRGQYYEGFVDDYKSVLAQHRMATVTTYGIRRSTTRACVHNENEKENDSEAGNIMQTSEVIITVFFEQICI